MTAGNSYLYQPVVVERLVRVERIPDGTPVDLQPGTSAQVAQALGYLHEAESMSWAYVAEKLPCDGRGRASHIAG